MKQRTHGTSPFVEKAVSFILGAVAALIAFAVIVLTVLFIFGQYSTFEVAMQAAIEIVIGAALLSPFVAIAGGILGLKVHRRVSDDERSEG